MFEVAIFLLLVNVISYWGYRNAEKARSSQIRLRAEEAIKYKLLGFSKKSLDNKVDWVRRYRMYITIIWCYFNVLGLAFFFF
jgi:hypothetical protein